MKRKEFLIMEKRNRQTWKEKKQYYSHWVVLDEPIDKNGVFGEIDSGANHKFDIIPKTTTITKISIKDLINIEIANLSVGERRQTK